MPITKIQKQLKKVVLQHGSRELVTGGMKRTGKALQAKFPAMFEIEVNELNQQRLKIRDGYFGKHQEH